MFGVVQKEIGNIESIEIIDLPKPIKMHSEDLLIQHTAFTISNDDIAIAKGKYTVDYTPQMKDNNGILGLEASGVIKRVGSKVQGFAVGDRIAYCLGSIGALCEQRVVHSSIVTKIPDGVSDEDAAFSLRKLMTIHTLLYRVVSIHKGWIVMIHDVTEPLESMLCQVAKSAGLSVIGTVTNEKDKEEAKTLNCDLILQRGVDNMYDKIFEFSKGQGVRIAFDSVGDEIVEETITCMQHLGSLVCYQTKSNLDASAYRDEFAKKSLSFLCPTLEHYKMSKDEFKIGMDASLGALVNKIVSPKYRKASVQEAKKVFLAINEKKIKDNVLLTP